MKIDIREYLREEPVRETYTVKPGDSLYKIAKQYGVSVDELMDLNELDSTVIYPNQVLILPKNVGNGGMYFFEYIVQPNDTLSKIAEANSVTAETIGKYNDVSKMILAEGQMLNIPATYKTYVVQEGDTLTGILSKTNLTLEEFLELNLSRLITPGTTIYYR